MLLIFVKFMMFLKNVSENVMHKLKNELINNDNLDDNSYLLKSL